MRPHHLLQLVPNRVAATVERLRAKIWTRETRLAVEATEATPQHLTLQEAAGRPRTISAPGQAWGRLFDQRWCWIRLSDSVTAGPANYLEWRDQGEGTAYVDGVPYYGFDVAHRYCRLPPGAREVWLESICAQTGIWHPEATGLSASGSVFDGAFLVQRDEEAWHAYHDLSCLSLFLLSIRPSGPRLNPIGFQAPLDRAPPVYRRLLRVLDEAIDALDRGGIGAMRRRLAEVYAEFRETSAFVTATLTGHAHIDLVWLWPERVGEAKALHSFATADRLMQLYPEFRFVHSQPASYEAVARRAPKLLERVKSRMAAGRWEATGVLYVESDTQLPCGEALARGFSVGQLAFTQLRGSPSQVVWLPDAFGYSSCLPQLMQQSGVSFFFTNKVSWSAINRFPVSSFVWRGSDGSEVLAHVLQEVGYNGAVLPEDLDRAAQAHLQSDVHPEFLYPTGYGDGGGGATEEMCERARRLAAMRGLPAVGWDLPEAFFGRLARRRAALPTYAGEFYLEYHRGTYTTHADIKAAFRGLERALQVREAAIVVTRTTVDLNHVWRRMLFAQFHDYIPGSSIPEVYAEALPELRQLAADQMAGARAQLAQQAGVACLFNPLPVAQLTVIDDALVRLPPLAGVAMSEAKVADFVPVDVTGTSLSNGIVSATLDESGVLVGLIIDGERMLLESGGVLTLYPDRPANFESWDIDRQALGLGETVATAPTITVERDTAGLRGAVVVRRKLGKASTVKQRFILDSCSRVLRIEIELDWHEEEMLLKLHFETGYRGTHVRCGAPFGSILRPQLPGTPAAEAMWEVPASRWIAGTDDGGRRGLFIVTQAKYGFSCDAGDWGVSLVRSPRMTGFDSHRDAYAAKLSRLEPTSIYSDQGTHSISLAIGRYDLAASRENHPAALADLLFTPPLQYVGTPRSAGLRGLSGGETLVPCWAKPVDADCWVLRLHEVAGESGYARIDLDADCSARRVDLNERPVGAVITDRRIEYRPYEIVSVMISRTDSLVGHRDRETASAVCTSLWHGFHREDFSVDGRACILVRPVASLPSRPWIWRTEFFGVFASVDLALLKAGFHLAYIDVQNMYGSPTAMGHMDAFYACLTGIYGLAPKPVLEGFSRGALFAMNWAVRNPGAVSCLYLDAPVCDFRSWPGGRGRAAGSVQDWQQLLLTYGLTERQALGPGHSPVDNLGSLAAAGIPIVAVYGEADEDLPPEENILLAQKRYGELGGEIEVIAKPGIGHHPHSLADPTPILNFIFPRAL
jgi:alpha-mannosidase